MKSVHVGRSRAVRSVAAAAAVAGMVMVTACGSDDDDAVADSGNSMSAAPTTGESDAEAPTSSVSAATAPAPDDSPAASVAVGAGDAGPMTIQFTNPLPNYPAWRLIGDCMKEQADALGVDLTETGPTGQALDSSVMIQQIQQGIANEKDAILTFPASEGFTEVLKQAQAAGIVTGTLYGPGGDNGADVNAGPDWNHIGETLVNAVAALPGDHVLGLVAQSDAGLGKSWLDGVKAAAANTDNVAIAGEVYTGDDAAKALPQVTALLTAHPDVTEIVTHMGTVTPGAVAAIKSLGRQGETFLVAGGHDNGGTEAIEEGTANLMLMQDVCTLGKQLVEGVVGVAGGEPAPEIPVQIAVIGKDEIQQYLDDGWV